MCLFDKTDVTKVALWVFYGPIKVIGYKRNVASEVL